MALNGKCEDPGRTDDQMVDDRSIPETFFGDWYGMQHRPLSAESGERVGERKFGYRTAVGAPRSTSERIESEEAGEQRLWSGVRLQGQTFPQSGLRWHPLQWRDRMAGLPRPRIYARRFVPREYDAILQR
jgi:hypothetical protein